MKKELVKDWMTRAVVTITPDVTLPEAHRLMLEKKISGLPVVDNEQRLVGIITESDIFRLVVQEWHKD